VAVERFLLCERNITYKRVKTNRLAKYLNMGSMRNMSSSRYRITRNITICRFHLVLLGWMQLGRMIQEMVTVFRGGNILGSCDLKEQWRVGG